MPQSIDAPAVALGEKLLKRAHELGASDLHLDPTEAGVDVRLRRDGVLEELEQLGEELRDYVVGRFKALADLLVYRSDVPQEGRIPAARSGIGSDLRVA